MRQPQKIKRRCPFASGFCFGLGELSIFKQLGLFRGDFKMKLVQALFHGFNELSCIVRVLKTGDIIIGITDQPGIALADPFYALFKPQVQCVVKIDIGKQW